MLSALATTLSRESRTSFGDPVEPLVAQQHREVGVQVVDGARSPFDHAGPAVSDHVGVVALDQAGVALEVTGAEQQHRVAARERRQVGRDGVEVVGALEHHQAPSGPEHRRA